MKCPGQDRAYWHGERVFEVPCPKCGSTVEFFRDEVSRRCSRCGHRLSNPRVALDCASWCDQAEACMGLSRSRLIALGREDTALAGRLIQGLEEVLPQEPAKIARALLVFQHARELASAAGVNPVVVLSAALLLEMDGDLEPDSAIPSSQHAGEGGGSPCCREVLSRARLDDESIARIDALLDDFRHRRNEECAEVRVLRDSLTLADMTVADHPADLRVLESQIEDQLQTDAGKTWARSLFQPITLSASSASSPSNGAPHH